MDVDREYMDRAYTPQRFPLEQLYAAAEVTATDVVTSGLVAAR